MVWRGKRSLQRFGVEGVGGEDELRCLYASTASTASIESISAASSSVRLTGPDLSIRGVEEWGEAPFLLRDVLVSSGSVAKRLLLMLRAGVLPGVGGSPRWRRMVPGLSLDHWRGCTGGGMGVLPLVLVGGGDGLWHAQSGPAPRLDSPVLGQIPWVLHVEQALGLNSPRTDRHSDRQTDRRRQAGRQAESEGSFGEDSDSETAGGGQRGMLLARAMAWVY
jgi:hypothetical protein